MEDNVGSAPSNKRPGESGEGVRIIGAEEAAQAMERGDVVARRSDSQRYGNRPPPPPAGPRPALRFPLDATSDPQHFEKPALRPTPPRPDRSWGVSVDDAAGSADIDLRPGRSSTPSPSFIDGGNGAADATAARDGSEDETMTGERPVDQPGVDRSDSAGSSDTAPMPHWTDPATGEVPAVLASETGDEEEHLDAWASFAGPTARWHDDWDDALLQEPPHADVKDSPGTAGDRRSSGDELAETQRVPVVDIDRDPEDAAHFHFDAAAGHGAVLPGGSTAAASPRSGASRLKGALAKRRRKAAPQAQAPAPAPGAPMADLTFDPTTEIPAPPAVEAGVNTASGSSPETPAPPRRRRRRPRPTPPAHAGPSSPEESDLAVHGNRGRSELVKRVLVGVALMGLLVLSLAIGPAVALALVVLVMAISALEFFNSVRQVGYQPAVFPGLLATVFLPVAVYNRGLDAVPVVLAVVVLFGMVWYLVGADGGDGRIVEGLGLTMFGVGWIGILGSFAAAMLRFEDGRGMLVAAVLATVAYDIGGFFVGRSPAGTTPLIAISPNKTREGLLGGMVVCFLMCVVVIGLVPGVAPFDSIGRGFQLFLLAAIAAPLGDLCESLVKRDLGLKDMGALLPGHGGLLDRIDGLLFVLPATYFALVLFSIGPFAR